MYIMKITIAEDNLLGHFAIPDYVRPTSILIYFGQHMPRLRVRFSQCLNAGVNTFNIVYNISKVEHKNALFRCTFRCKTGGKGEI